MATLQNKDAMCYGLNCTMLARVRIARAGKHHADPLRALGRWCVLKAEPGVVTVCASCHHYYSYAGEFK